MQLDHLAVTCADLAEGTDRVAAALGVPLQPGGKHARFGTHNTLLGLGPGEYLEVIAPDPTAPPPAGPRWFGLDEATGARLGNWIVRVPDLGAALQGRSEMGEMLALERGDLKWRIAVPPDGSLPRGGACPTLIEWQGTAPHPSTRLTDQGVRLLRLVICHPDATALDQRFTPALHDPRIRFETGPMALMADFSTPHGMRQLA